MARMSALSFALALCQSIGLATASLRGHHTGHRHPHRVSSHFQLPAEKSMAPLYDDFLDIMNHASDKALQEQRAIPAYDDFLHLLRANAEQAFNEQSGKPSYDDFLIGLKASSAEAMKTPVPSYEDFLKVLKAGAADAMQQRVQHEELHGDAIKVLKKEDSVEKMSGDIIQDEKMLEKANPLDRLKKKTDEVLGHGKHDDHDDDPLKQELRELQEEQRRNEAKNGPGNGNGHKKPLMKRINVLRTQLCWKRPNLWEHEKCLRFLGLHCLQESTGEGICKAFTKESKNRCADPNANPELKEDYCALAEALGESYGEDEEEEQAAEEHSEEHPDQQKDQHEDQKEEHEEGAAAVTEEAGEDAIDEEAVGSDEDLEKDLQEQNKKMKDNKDKGAGEEEEVGDEDEAEAIKEDGDEEEVVEDDEAADKEDSITVNDRDGDGTPNDKDAFPDDASEWLDTDKDGVGDNADEDLDGDGTNNDLDKFPFDPKEQKDSDHDGIGDNADKDRDNDGFDDDKDKFPDDATEWLDSDEDGVGDNKDAYPYNPDCHDADLPCDKASKKGPKAGSAADPTTLDMDTFRPLPDQGFSEHMTGGKVAHNNYYTWVGDWQDEFPEMGESETDTLASICKEHPNNSWCVKFDGKEKQAHFR